jgi:hypothetical protein
MIGLQSCSEAVIRGDPEVILFSREAKEDENLNFPELKQQLCPEWPYCQELGGVQVEGFH